MLAPSEFILGFVQTLNEYITYWQDEMLAQLVQQFNGRNWKRIGDYAFSCHCLLFASHFFNQVICSSSCKYKFVIP